MTALISIALIHLFALMSPGPDFFFVTQSAIRQSRSHALCAALGIALSILVWSICAVSGLHYLFQKIGWLQQVLMVCGGIYLCYLGYQLLKSAFKPAISTPAQHTATNALKSRKKLLLQGFLTNMANPKALVYFSSVFALAINTDATLLQQSSVLALIFFESLLWFALVAVLFSTSKINHYYQKISQKIDGITGGIFISFGCMLILNRD
ncbi:threonine export protein RhtC [Acinetobacter cumulans]|uniref:Threonine export protein RhtC n=1 Tax=Acinetobacter cumulans TaxID=2136182 RepID=A0ABX9UAQ3_9GAMM|nr:LysE family transporter [Acinetobacter cumulans]QCO21843.1 threonine export protein RhtC [Acinetobacter cumulans]RKG50857.1 threonine export protein RhtC [Acinetobacter cumulans]RLL50310.1 threonine export protein RhtC [Acinetobacter cumulans]